MVQIFDARVRDPPPPALDGEATTPSALAPLGEISEAIDADTANSDWTMTVSVAPVPALWLQRARVTGWVILPHPPFLQREYTFCTDGCWIEVPLSIGAGTVVDDVGVGSYVEIYGKLFESGMPGETRIDVSRVVEIVDAGTCGVVSSPTQSWGALKSRFD